ncbi:MAG: cysteine--tRNA ligase [Candidatus Marinimicrobia bacterium]|nr:cysteine--tRNA ligase [Candidatus Neomarinimicrobiota bacterium]
MMEIRFYNTLTRKKEIFKPINKGKVSLYTCGPTVYNRAHIGNFRTFIFEDVLKRVLQLVGYNVKHVMNITDVDDKTIKKAHEENKKLNKITSKYTSEFMEDLQALKILPADLFPAATDHIQNMIEMISILIENKNAYVADDGSVFFSIDSINDYGKLANLDLKRQKQTDRVAADEYTKDNPRDFALWKAWKVEDGDVFWDSPWGIGRPGWHMECSVMSTKYLGNHFDIHCGGVDNIFPHHENEIAQSCAALGTEFVNIWMHSEHLNMADEKMSKSLGNIKTIPELLDDGHSAESLRYVLISSHYRSKLSFSSNKLDDARKAVHRINDIYNRLQGIISDGNSFPNEYDQFIEALVDDLNTPKALGILFNYLKELNRKIDNDKLTDEESSRGILFIKKADEIFSFLKDKTVIPDEIAKLVAKRNEARKDKNWELSDLLREELKEKGWIVEDTLDGSKCYSA